MKTKTVKVWTDNDRYEYLCNYYHEQMSRDDGYKINRPNFNFLLLRYNNYLRAKEEIKELKLKIQMLEMGGRNNVADQN